MSDLANIDWFHILDRLKNYATSEVGRAELAEISPLSSEESAYRGFKTVEECQRVLLQGERPFMESLDLFSTWISRLEKGATLKTIELKDVRHFSIEVIALTEVLSVHETEWVSMQKRQLMDGTGPLSAIDHIMTPAGEIRTDASETLYNLYRERNQQSKSVQQILDKLVKKHELESVLQDKYVTNREGRMVIPIKSGMRHQFEGIIHAASSSKQTVFMEPEEIIPLNNRIRQIDSDIEAEIERLLTELSQYLASLSNDFNSSFEILKTLDMELSKAQLSNALNAVPIQFDQATIDLKELRHPVLVLSSENVVENNVKLEKEKRILLLSGPNAGGKTVLLKAVGLAAHMAACGLPVCATENSKLPFFKEIVVAVGDSQSVDEHLSTFAAHVKILNESTLHKSSDCLLLIDEICGSTDPEEGSALARAFIENYAENNVFGVITSHLGPLKLGWDENSGVINGSMEYSDKTGQPTYQFIMGLAGQSLAIRTAEKVGVHPDIIKKSLEYLTPESKTQEEARRDLDKQKEELREVRKNLQEQIRESRDTKAKYEKLMQEYRKEKSQMLDRALKRAEKKLDDMVEKAKVKDIFSKHDEVNRIKKEMPEVVKAKDADKSNNKISSLEDFEKAYPPGSQVYIANLQKDAVIQGGANGKGEIPVLSNSMRLFVHWEQLRPPQNAANPTQNIIRRSSAGVNVMISESYRTVDVRGQTIDDSVSTLELQMDAAMANGEERVKIVHGHGTEALKKAVRAHLSRSIYVRGWRAGTKDTGGDGVTWVDLDKS